MLNHSKFEVVSIHYHGGPFSALAEATMTLWHGVTTPPRRLRRNIVGLPFYLLQSLGRLVLLPIAVIIALLDLIYTQTKLPHRLCYPWEKNRPLRW